MRNVKDVRRTDDVPEGDAAEQLRSVDFDEETGLDTDYLSGDGTARDASEADLIDQAFIVGNPDEDR